MLNALPCQDLLVIEKIEITAKDGENGFYYFIRQMKICLDNVHLKAKSSYTHISFLVNYWN